MYSCTNNRRVSIIILPKAKFQNCDLKLSRSPRDKSKNSEDSNHLFHSRESKDRFKNATFLQIVENGYRWDDSAANSIEQVTSRDNGITYCRPKDTIGGSVAVTGKLFSVVVESANFAVTVEIRGVDTRVAVVVVVWSASWNQLTKLLSGILY